MSVFDTKDLDQLDLILHDRFADRNIIGHAIDTIKDLRTKNDTLVCECMKLRDDAERYRWLTDDHADSEVRQKCRDILNRMGVMSYGDACQSIDAARKE